MKKIILASILLLAFALAVMPSSAVIQEQYFKGQVSVIDVAKDMMTIQVTSVYEGDEWVTYAKATSIKNNIIRGTTDNPLILTELKQGDAVEACLIGGTDGNGEWIAIGRIGTVGSAETPLMTVYGDPSKLRSNFYQGYVFNYIPVADCTACTGSTCTSQSALVAVSKDGALVEEKTMSPGETYVFGKDSDNQYVLLVTYNFGQASANECASSPSEMMMGPQPINDFTIYDTQRSTIIESVIGTETAAPTVIATEATAVQTAAPTQAPTQAPMPTKSGLGIELIVIAGIIGSAIAVFRKD